MKRTIAVRDAEEDGLPGTAEKDGPERKRVKEEAGDMDAVLELTGDDFECVICCGEAEGHREHWCESTAALGSSCQCVWVSVLPR